MKNIYDQALHSATSELRELEAQKEEIETRIIRLRHVINGLRGISPGSDGGVDQLYEELSVTDSIRFILKTNKDRDFSCSEMRDALEQMGLPLSTYKNPLALCANVMKREKDAGDAEIIRRPNGNSAFKWQPRRFPRLKKEKG